MRPDFPQVVDSSMRSAFVECPQKFYYQYIRHWRKKGESVHLVAGGAFAKGAEVTRRSFFEAGKDLETAIADGCVAAIQAYGDFTPDFDTPKTCERVVEALWFYFTTYPLATDHAQPVELPSGKRAIEFTFAIPLELRHPQSGDPLIYAGRNDMLVSYNGDCYVFDDKTTSQLGASWPDSWTMRAQLTGYVWAAQQAGHHPVGAIVRGISFLKKSFGTAESLQLRPQWQIERWYAQLQRDIKRMISCWEEGYWDYNLDSACSSYGGCQYLQLCKVPNPDAWAETDYEVRQWNPLSHIKD